MLHCTFEVPIGIDAFVVPQGVTVNAGTWLVNNRRVVESTGGEMSVVPEPSTWLLVTLGLGFAATRLRRRT